MKPTEHKRAEPPLNINEGYTVITLKRRVLATLLLLCLTIPLTSCAPRLHRYEAQFLELFDTVTRVVGYSKDEETFTSYVETLRGNVKEYHELYDIYNDYPGVVNNIKTINDNAGIAPGKGGSARHRSIKVRRRPVQADGRAGQYRYGRGAVHMARLPRSRHGGSGARQASFHGGAAGRRAARRYRRYRNR
jgi:hypothetical protein